MDFLSRQSFDGESDRTNRQRQNGFEDTIRSDHSSIIDYSKHGIFVERTLALVKPDAINKAGEIETILLNNGFTVLQVCFKNMQKAKNRQSLKQLRMSSAIVKLSHTLTMARNLRSGLLI